MASLCRSITRLSARSQLRVLSVRTAYSNQNKPDSKQEVKKEVKDAKAGKASEDVAKQRAVTGGAAVPGETSEGRTGGTMSKQSVEGQINTADAGPDVLRQAAKKNGKKSA